MTKLTYKIKVLLMFKLSKKALRAINRPNIRIDLAQVLNCTERTIIRYISTNDDTLTKAAALEVIRKHTGLKDSEILVRLLKAA